MSWSDLVYASLFLLFSIDPYVIIMTEQVESSSSTSSMHVLLFGAATSLSLDFAWKCNRIGWPTHMCGSDKWKPNSPRGHSFSTSFTLSHRFRKGSLSDMMTTLFVNSLLMTLTVTAQPHVAQAWNDSRFAAILADFSTLTRTTFTEAPLTHSTSHDIVTNWLHVVTRPPCFAPDELAIAKAEFDHILELG